jgi:hypothetical protein
MLSIRIRQEAKICAAVDSRRETNGLFIYVTEKNRWLYFFALERPYRLAVRTPPFHGGGTGSIPVRVAIFSTSFGVNWQSPKLCMN